MVQNWNSNLSFSQLHLLLYLYRLVLFPPKENITISSLFLQVLESIFSFLAATLVNLS